MGEEGSSGSRGVLARNFSGRRSFKDSPEHGSAPGVVQVVDAEAVAVIARVQNLGQFHFAGGGGMDILVMLDEAPDHSPVLAHVNSVPAPMDADRPWRDVVTLYGVPNPESLALALAAAVESHRSGDGSGDAIRHLGLWPERGALGDAAWRDVKSGQLVTRDLEIPLEKLRATAGQLLTEFGSLIRRLVAGLSMPDWPEGARRAITVSLGPIVGLTVPVFAPLESMLDRLREADGLAFEYEGD